MKTLHLIKFIDHIQLGHLYEHIFLMQLGAMLREQGLLSSIDYRLDGSTFHKGAITITIDLYTEKAISFEKYVRQFSPKINTGAIDNGLLQISAEKFMKTETRDDEIIQATLKKYQDQTWQDIDTVGIRNVTSVRKRTAGLTLTGVPDDKILLAKLHVTLIPGSTISMDVVLPIFYVLSQVYIANLSEILAMKCGYFSYDDSYAYTVNKAIETNTYLVYDRHELTDEIHVSQDFLRSLDSVRLSEHIMQRYTVSSDGLPNIAELLDRCGIAVGPHGWREILTKEAIDSVMNDMTLSFRIGKNSATINRL